MDDWTTRAADAIESAVGAVRDRTVAPAQRATRAVVHGLLAGFFVATAVVLFVIGAFRGLVILTGEAWIAYMAAGGMLVVLGTFCWTRRTKRTRRRGKA